jgi:hypothetical protein
MRWYDVVLATKIGTMRYRLARPKPKTTNAIVRKALLMRPSTESVRLSNPCGCPICGAGSDSLSLVKNSPYMSTPTALQWLGVACRRWIRDRLHIECTTCGVEFSDGTILSWNAVSYRRRFADVGNLRMPLPFQKHSGSLQEMIDANIFPEKRYLVNTRAVKGAVLKAQRLSRSAHR